MIPEATLEWLREKAHKEHSSIGSIIREALDKEIDASIDFSHGRPPEKETQKEVIEYATKHGFSRPKEAKFQELKQTYNPAPKPFQGKGRQKK